MKLFYYTFFIQIFFYSNIFLSQLLYSYESNPKRRQWIKLVYPSLIDHFIHPAPGLIDRVTSRNERDHELREKENQKNKRPQERQNPLNRSGVESYLYNHKRLGTAGHCGTIAPLKEPTKTEAESLLFGHKFCCRSDEIKSFIVDGLTVDIPLGHLKKLERHILSPGDVHPMSYQKHYSPEELQVDTAPENDPLDWIIYGDVIKLGLTGACCISAPKYFYQELHQQIKDYLQSAEGKMALEQDLQQESTNHETT